MKHWIAFITATFFSQALWADDIQATLQWSQRVDLSTPVSGTVQTVNVQVGDLVRKGQVLLSLDNTIYQARVAETGSEIARLKAETEEDQRDLDRVQELHERTVVATAELDQARLKLVRSQSALAEARARLLQNRKALDDASIRAPFDAVVILRQAEPGLSVAAGLQPQVLLTVARSGEMIANMNLASGQIGKLKVGQAMIVSAEGKDYSGKIKKLGMEPARINEEWLYPVDVAFPVPEPLRAGTPARVKLP